MKECLHCEKKFNEQRETAKFCSTSCRVMYHRKHGKKDAVKPMQMQVIYNAILDAITKIGQQNSLPPSFSSIINLPKENIASQMPKLRRSFDYFKQARVDCQTEDEWQELRLQIINSDLSEKQKILLTS